MHHPLLPKSLAWLVWLTLGLGLTWSEAASAQTPGWRWAIAPGAGYGYGTTVDAAGNVYVTGEFYSRAAFGTHILTNSGSGGIYVAKRSSAGTWLWATQADGLGDDYGHRIAVDASGNVYVAGGFESATISFGATTLTGVNTGVTRPDAFVAKLSPAGVW